ncbi:MAG TPA: hypothetical protein DCM73_09090 [Clostridiales bacterium]|nr:hypothetical protein [Clostridiales bacterium]
MTYFPLFFLSFKTSINAITANTSAIMLKIIFMSKNSDNTLMIKFRTTDTVSISIDTMGKI